MSETQGWYSAKYDSTKQKSIMNQINRGFPAYLTSLRFEMLLSGMVVITDAQWYDGSFFAYMANDKTQFSEFKEFLMRGFENGNSTPPLTIRRRNNYPQMFAKNFTFSSIKCLELQQFMYHLWDNVDDDKTAICTTLESYLEYVKNRLTKEHSKLLPDFIKFEEGIKELDSVNEKLFVPFGESNYMLACISAIKGELFKILNMYDSSNLTIEYETIEKQLNTEYPNRSIIKENVTKIALANGATPIIQAFMHLFDNNYNKAIALQHNCRYYDLYDAISNITYNNSNNICLDLHTLKFPQPVLNYLAHLNWKEFGDIYYDEDVTKKRTEWLRAFDTNIVEDAERSFVEYLNYIFKKMQEMGLWLINESVFYKASGTERFIEIDTVEKLVGYTNSDILLYTNEFSLFLSGKLNPSDKNKIIRYSSSLDVSNMFGTVFAPIENVISKSVSD